MNVALKQAYEIAASLVGGSMQISSAREGVRHWFFDVSDSSGYIIPGSSPIVIDKRTGEASQSMPPVPSAALGRPSLPIEDEARGAKSIPLPL